MSQLLLFLPSHEVKLVASPVKITNTHQYRLEVMIWGQLAFTIQDTPMTTAGVLIGAIGEQAIPAGTWTKMVHRFTATATALSGQIVIRFPTAGNTIRIDDAKLIDVTLETKQYRIMRIKGSMFPGSYIQTLTLREKTATETA